MKYYLLSALLPLTLISCGQEKISQEQSIVATDQLFEAWNKDQTPGAVVGIIQNGAFIYSNGYGLANLEHNIRNTENTAFNIASNSKQFTAACIVILSLKGEITLTQNVAEFFSDFPSYFSDITIEHLLHHTSGLRDFSQITYLSGLRPDDYYDDQNILKWITSQESLNFDPGEKHLYSNSGYWLLGQIVEKVSGMSLAAFAKQALFDPLNMSGTLFYDNNSLIVKNRASGYFRNRTGKYRHTYSTLEHTGNGGVYSTLTDLKKWDDEFYNRTILKDEFWELMTTPGKLNNGETITYAKALMMGSHSGLATIDHGGRAPGYQSNIVRFPEENFTVIVLANASNLNATRLCYNIADIFLKDKLKKVTPPQETSIKTTKLKSDVLEKYAGHYWSLNNNISRKVILANDTLKYERSRGRDHALVPTSQSTFKMLGTPAGMNVKVSFKEDKEAAIMCFEENGTEVDQWKKYEPVNYSPVELTKFAGTYHSQEIATTYQIKIENQNQLFLYIDDRQIVPLRPVMENLFSSPMGIFRFSQSDKGDMVALFVSTPRVKNLTFLKF